MGNPCTKTCYLKQTLVSLVDAAFLNAHLANNVFWKSTGRAHHNKRYHYLAAGALTNPARRNIGRTIGICPNHTLATTLTLFQPEGQTVPSIWGCSNQCLNHSAGPANRDLDLMMNSPPPLYDLSSCENRFNSWFSRHLWLHCITHEYKNTPFVLEPGLLTSKSFWFRSALKCRVCRWHCMQQHHCWQIQNFWKQPKNGWFRHSF